MTDEKSTYQAYVKDKEGGSGNDAYDIVFEDQVEFISHEILAGTRKKHDHKSHAQEEEEEENLTLTAYEIIFLGRRRLPVYSYCGKFLAAMRDNKVLAVMGETGCLGKTTQLPQYMHEASWER